MGKLEDAAQEFEAYLKSSVDPKDGEAVRTRIAELRKARVSLK
jgi:hypothetical protein